MHILKKPDLTDPKLRAKLAKGMGHNYYGEPAWPNDLLYIFPVVILGTIACIVGLSVLDPAMLGDKADPFATPLEILPEWYLYPVFQILRVVPNKLLGIAMQTLVPLGLMLIPFIESFCNNRLGYFNQVIHHYDLAQFSTCNLATSAASSLFSVFTNNFPLGYSVKSQGPEKVHMRQI